MAQRILQKGLTLAETLIAATVLSIAVAAFSQAIVSGQMQMYQAANAARATQLAEGLMERVRSMPYYDPNGQSNPGPEPGESIPLGFDNADDFHNYSESPGQLKDALGNLHPATHQRFSRRVTAQYGTQMLSGIGSITGLTVTVTVTDSRGATWTLTRFITQPAVGT